MSEIDTIVLDLDGGAMLQRCIDSLLEQTVPTRILVVDNGSAIPASGRLRSHPRVVLVRHEQNLGFTGGVNSGFRHVEAPFVALVNNDVRLEPDCLSRLRAVLDHSPAVAGVQPIVMSDGELVDGAGITISDGRFRQVGHGLPLTSLADCEDAWGVSATVALFRADALRDCSPADGAILHPLFFAYYEDVELSARLRKREWEVRVLAEPLAFHERSASSGKIGAYGDYLRVRNRYFVARLHPGVGTRSSLFLEDLGRLSRLALSRDYQRVRSTLRGIADGLRQPLGHQRSGT